MTLAEALDAARRGAASVPGSHADREDAAAEALASLWLRFGDEVPTGLAYVTARFRQRTLRRAAGRGPILSPMQDWECGPGRDAGPVAMAEALELAERAERALERLSPRQLEALLKDLAAAGESTWQRAEAAGCWPNTYTARLRRIRGEARRHYAEIFGAPPG